VRLDGDLFWPPRDGDGGKGGGGGGGGDGSGGEESRPDDDGARAATVAFGVGLWMLAIGISFVIFFIASWAILHAPGVAAVSMPEGMTLRLSVSTLLLAVSSASIELARRAFARARPALARRWLAATLLLALAFLASQALAWVALFEAGIRPSTNTLGTTFTTLTAMHGLHILGGLAYILAARRKLPRASAAASATLRSCARYWHFLGLLWLLLLAVLLALF
jgi:cytochrome c oxidase subunit 3